MEVKVQIVKRETIKPSSPTPSDLRSFKLSLLDQLAPDFYTPLLLFYNDHHGQLAPEEKSGRLKLSLSRTLCCFYPLAGRIRDNLSIECTDQGAELIESKVSCCLSDILIQPNLMALEKLLPAALVIADARDGPLLHVQVNFFNCGGLVIGLCMSHKLTDAATLSTFVNAWAGESRGSTNIVLPEFCLSSIFPPADYLTETRTWEMPRSVSVTRQLRLVVGSSRIAALRTRAASNDVPRPTAVEAVTALVWKSSAAASRKNSNLRSGPKTTMLSQAVNLRKRVDPPLPENSVGNMGGIFMVQSEETELKLPELACHLRKGIREYQRHYVEHLQGERGVPAILRAATDFGARLVNDRVDHYSCSSWCKFPLYTADFGWGKPTWASVAGGEFKNGILLINTPDGEGIEVWLTLTKADMDLVERDEELLEFASLNPSVL